MDALRTPPAVAAFLTRIRACGADTATQTMVCHSIRAWAPSYHYLQTARVGHYAPRLERQGPSSRVTQAVRGAARTVLAGIADTFCCLFCLPWTRLEVSHMHLTATFPRVCATYGLTGDTEYLYARMRALYTCLHVSREASWSPPGAGSPASATVHEIVTELEQYTVGMLAFFERNVAHSVLCPGTRPLVEHAPPQRCMGQPALGPDKAQRHRVPSQRALPPML